MTLPADEAGIEALFARLPEDVAGEERDWPTDDFDVPGEADAAWGPGQPEVVPPLSLRAVDVSTDDFFEPGSTAADVVILLAEDPAEGVAASGEDAGVMWVRWERPGAYRLAWGEADSPWLFVAEAASPEGLAALVTAFLATAREGAVTSQAPAGTGAASPSPSSRLSWPQQLTANVGALTAGTGYARAVSRAGLSRSS